MIRKGKCMMSKFYGQVFGQASTTASRRSSKDIEVSAQSWDGSLITKLYYNDAEELMVNLEHSDTSSTSGRVLFRGTMTDLVAKLAVV